LYVYTLSFKSNLLRNAENLGFRTCFNMRGCENLANLANLAQAAAVYLVKGWNTVVVRVSVYSNSESSFSTMTQTAETRFQ
jgi:hypothetical protein